jgi:hypothetical protein
MKSVLNVKMTNRRRNMKIENWTLGLAAVGLVTLSPALLAQDAAPQLVPIQTALTATTISGYVDTSAVWNPGTGNANPAPYAFNVGKQDGFNLNAVDVKIAKAEGEERWAAGYVAELSYGPDAQAIDGGAYPIRQAYIELKMPVGNGLNWQIGRWDSLLGYESSDSMSNPNYTKSYGKTFEPTENTGLLGSYQFCDAFTLQAGVADTLDTLNLNSRSDPGAYPVESKKSVLTKLILTAPESWGDFKGSKLVAGFDHGQGADTAISGAHDRTEWYVGTTINTPVKDLTFGASWDWIHDVDVAGNVPAGTMMVPTGVEGFVPAAGLGGAATLEAHYVNAIAGYVSYKATEKLTLSGRVEWANGDALTDVLYLDNGIGGAVPETSAVKFDKVLALTGTVQYQLWDNVISRFEVRWDHAADGVDAFGGTGSPASGIAPNAKNEVTIAANVIYKF